jgi:hypothetical protein
LLNNVAPALRGSVIGLRSLAIYGLPMGLMAAGALLNRGMPFEWLALLYGAAGIGSVILLWVKNRPYLD